ncbi:MAG: hypothetical protein AAB875_00575, partial [Patescibacteria group bacterium]
RQVSKEVYLASFGQRVPRNYQIADFVVNSTSKDEKIFVWGPDSSSVYALSRRLPPGKFVADYHITDFSSKEAEAKILEEAPPKFIILLPDALGFTEITGLLRSKYMLISDIQGAEVWRRTNSQKNP